MIFPRERMNTMTINELSEILSLKELCVCERDRKIKGCYTGDLLSWVMGKAGSGDVWVTIMTNVNIVAVAMLTDVSCIIVAENAEMPAETLERAREKNVNIYTSEKSAYELCSEISKYI